MIRIQVFNAHPKVKRRHEGICTLLRRVLKDELAATANINIIFVNDRVMIGLNTNYLHHKYTTDVLSFPLSESENVLEGEVYVNIDQAQRQARELGISIKEEIARLVIHGVLHLVGYDDRTVREKQKMTQRENYYLNNGK
jgi:probable rRNA maturation factor